MEYKAHSKYVRISPYKLRGVANAIRGDSVANALAWLQTCALRRIKPLQKTLVSAYSNARHQDQKVSLYDLFIKEIRIDQGPIFKYFKPSAMGRAAVQRKRLSHIKIVLEKKSA